MVKLFINGLFVLYVILLISCEAKTNKISVLNKTQTRENVVIDTSKKKEIKKRIIVKKDSFEMNGIWKVENKFLRQMSAISNEDLGLYCKDSIIIEPNKIRFFKDNICNYTSIVLNETNIDDEILEKFKIKNSNNKELIFKCNNYNEYLYLIDNNFLIYELDGGVFLLKKWTTASNSAKSPDFERQCIKKTRKIRYPRSAKCSYEKFHKCPSYSQCVTYSSMVY